MKEGTKDKLVLCSGVVSHCTNDSRNYQTIVEQSRYIFESTFQLNCWSEKTIIVSTDTGDWAPTTSSNDLQWAEKLEEPSRQATKSQRSIYLG